MTESDKIYDLDNIEVWFDQIIIAINRALVAYSMKQIGDELLSWKLIPIGLTIIFWQLIFTLESIQSVV